MKEVELLNEEEVRDLIADALREYVGENNINITTYEQTGLLTKDKGLVISVGDGDYKIEYQITIVRSK